MTLGLFLLGVQGSRAAVDACRPAWRWLLDRSSDVVARPAARVATFSKPPNALLIVPVLALAGLAPAVVRALGVAVLFAVSSSALLRRQHGDHGRLELSGRRAEHVLRRLPFQTPESGFDVGMDRATNRVLTDVIFDSTGLRGRCSRTTSCTSCRPPLGLRAVLLPGGLRARRFPLAASGGASGGSGWCSPSAVAEILLLIVWIPYNYFGGGGVLGNRYFMNVYGAFLFLLPPIDSVGVPCSRGSSAASSPRRSR